MHGRYVVLRDDEGWTIEYDGMSSKTYPTRKSAIDDAIRRAIVEGDAQILVRD